jgi:hypothetical protein
MSHPLRRALAPLGAMLALGLMAGYLVIREPAHPAAPADPAPRSAAVSGRTTARSQDSPIGYQFLLTQQDGVTPIRWDPCRPIHLRINPNGLAPASEIAEVRSAFDTLGRALGGVRFVYDGTTDVVPDVVDDAGKAGADLVFAFAEAGDGPDRSSLLTGWEAGRGGFAASGLPSGPDGAIVQRPTHGSVVVDADKWSVMNRHDRRVLYLHEIGHAVGLDHPQAAGEIMTSGAYDLPARYQPGDLAGLARLGRRAGCGVGG